MSSAEVKNGSNGGSGNGNDIFLRVVSTDHEPRSEEPNLLVDRVEADPYNAAYVLPVALQEVYDIPFIRSDVRRNYPHKSISPVLSEIWTNELGYFTSRNVKASDQYKVTQLARMPQLRDTPPQPPEGDTFIFDVTNPQPKRTEFQDAELARGVIGVVPAEIMINYLTHLPLDKAEKGHLLAIYIDTLELISRSTRSNKVDHSYGGNDIAIWPGRLHVLQSESQRAKDAASFFLQRNRKLRKPTEAEFLEIMKKIVISSEPQEL